jgi:apolipoprotein N-acyltransferase
VYSSVWRIVIAVLLSISAVTLFAILFRLSSSGAGPLNPLSLLRIASAGCVVPALAALLLRRLFSAALGVENESLVIRERHQTVEVPIRELESLEPWFLPVPAPGVNLRLSGGKRWRDGVEIAAPSRLIEALSGTGLPSLNQLRWHPSVVFAEAKQAFHRRSVGRWIAKFPLFALVPTLPLFRVHQVIAYGGAFGEYYQYGLKAYVSGFAVYWATLTVYLMVYGAILRAFVEALSFVSAHLTPAYASEVRRWSERAGAAFFFLGVPVLVILRFVPW